MLGLAPALGSAAPVVWGRQNLIQADLTSFPNPGLDENGTDPSAAAAKLRGERRLGQDSAEGTSGVSDQPSS